MFTINFHVRILVMEVLSILVNKIQLVLINTPLLLTITFKKKAYTLHVKMLLVS